MWKTWLLCMWITSIPAVVHTQEPTSEEKQTTASTDLRIQVKGGDEAMPVKGATVYLEWKEGGETKTREGSTNSEGHAGPYRLPRGRVFVQITTSDEMWQTYGDDHELTKEQETITVNLKKKLGTFTWLGWRSVHD